MARMIDMTALRKQLDALERAAMQAAQKAAPVPQPMPVSEDDNDEGVSLEGPAAQDTNRIAAAPVMARTPVKTVQKHSLIRDPKALRRAIILSEILSPPVAKRR